MKIGGGGISSVGTIASGIGRVGGGIKLGGVKFSGPISFGAGVEGPRFGCVNEGLVPKVTLKASVVEYGFKSLLSAPKMPSILTQTKLLNRQDIAPQSPEAPAGNLQGFTAWRPESRRVPETKLKVAQPATAVGTTVEVSKHAEAKLAQVRAFLRPVTKKTVSPALEAYGVPVVLPALKPAEAFLSVADAKLQQEPKVASLPQLVAVPKPEVEVVQAKEQVKKSIQQEEKSDKDERAFIEDEPVNATREGDLDRAEQLLESEVTAGIDVDARQLADIVPDEDESRRSGIIKQKGPDGGYKKYKEALKHAGKFSTVKALISYAFEKMKENTAVAFGKGGKAVGSEKVVNVLDRGLFDRESVTEVARRLVSLKKPGKIEVSGATVKIEYENEKIEKVVETKQALTPTVKNTPLRVYGDRLLKLAPKPLVPVAAFSPRGSF